MARGRQRCVLVGRDGVINRRLACGEVLSWKQIEFLPRALDGLRLLAEHGHDVLVISNQQGVGKGLLCPHELHRLTRRLLLEVALAGGKIDKVYYCTHAPTDGCGCRAPRPGLLRRAMAEYALRAADTYVISDSSEDMEAAAVAGCPAILLQRNAFLTSGVNGDGGGVEIASNLHEAAELIVRRGLPTLEEILRKEWAGFDFAQRLANEFTHHSRGHSV
jgi:D-glycero-D-manno-heptose 1,7-bisphosphate phosphatase